jgi:hypothetical protein
VNEWASAVFFVGIGAFCVGTALAARVVVTLVLGVVLLVGGLVLGLAAALDARHGQGSRRRRLGVVREPALDIGGGSAGHGWHDAGIWRIRRRSIRWQRRQWAVVR